MKEILKKLYHDYYIEPKNEFDFTNYYYFMENDGSIFGISKSILTANELTLIKSQYSLVSEDLGLHKHQALVDFLFGKCDNLENFKQIKYYFIKYLHMKNQEPIVELDELIHELFCSEVIFLKLQNIYVLISYENIDNQFTDSLKSIESDFFVPIIGYISDAYEVNNEFPKYFQFDYQNFKKYTKKNQLIIRKNDLIQNTLFSHLDETTKKAIKEYILKEFVHDLEMLNVIKAYFINNFNLSLAAKNCYMHRNTFINKIDRFIQVTNFNIREYHDALLVYLAIII